MTNKIGYKLGGCFEDFGADGESIAFEILFPMVFESKEEIESGEHDAISALMAKEPNGEVVIILCYKLEPVETIHWDEWWKYKCTKLKDEAKDELIADSWKDFEPHCAKFEDIFENFAGEDEDDNSYELQYLAYWVEPVFM
jgi:hypothetical protein